MSFLFVVAGGVFVAEPCPQLLALDECVARALCVSTAPVVVIRLQPLGIIVITATMNINDMQLIYLL